MLLSYDCIDGAVDGNRTRMDGQICQWQFIPLVLAEILSLEYDNLIQGECALSFELPKHMALREGT